MRQSITEILQALSRAFPEYDGRVVASAGDSINKDNLPHLPLIAVQLIGITATRVDFQRGINNKLDLRDEYQIEIWLNPRRVKQKNGLESPFWSYQDALEPLLRVLAALYGLENAKFEFIETQIQSHPYALIFSHRIRQYYSVTTAECITEPEKCGVKTPDEIEKFIFTLSEGGIYG